MNASATGIAPGRIEVVGRAAAGTSRAQAVRRVDVGVNRVQSSVEGLEG
jgi:hypothetical protein